MKFHIRTLFLPWTTKSKLRSLTQSALHLSGCACQSCEGEHIPRRTHSNQILGRRQPSKSGQHGHFGSTHREEPLTVKICSECYPWLHWDAASFYEAR